MLFVNRPEDANDSDLYLLSRCDTIDDVKTIIAGHSHTYAIGDAMIREELSPKSVVAARTAGFGILRLSSSDDYWKALISVSEGRNIGLSWHGNQHLCEFTFAIPSPFDLHCSVLPHIGVRPDVQIVPEEMVRAHFRPHIEMMAPLIDELRNANRIFLLSAPPPQLSDDVLRAMFRCMPSHTELANSLGIDLGTIPITPLSTMVKLWAVLHEAMAEFAQRNGLIFISAPPQSLTEICSLKADFWCGDTSHANYRYGALVIDRIIETIN